MGRRKEEQQKSAAETKGLTERIKAVLGEKVKDVRTTTRLTTSPACLVVDEYGYGSQPQTPVEGGRADNTQREAYPGNKSSTIPSSYRMRQ